MALISIWPLFLRLFYWSFYNLPMPVVYSSFRIKRRSMVAVVLVLLAAVASCSARSPVHDPSESHDYVLAYPDMPADGVRPIDVNGLGAGHARSISPCVMPFLKVQFKRLGLSTSQLRNVRFHSFSEPVDAVNDVAFSNGFHGITRGNDIYIAPQELHRAAGEAGELVFFHELVHTAQFQTGELSISSYALSSVHSFVMGKGPHDNDYEADAVDTGQVLLSRWKASKDRARCYPDDRLNPVDRRVGHRSDVIILYASWQPDEARFKPYSMQF